MLEFIYDKDLEDSIKKEFYKELGRKIKIALPKIKSGMSDLVYTLFIKTEEYASLTSVSEVGGISLMREFGLDRETATQTVEKIIRTFVNQIDIKYSDGLLQIDMIESDFNDILNMPESSYISHSKTRNTDTPIDWLDWFLTQGDRIIIKGWDIIYGIMPDSRSGGAIMVPNKTGFWRLPKYGGTIEDNWITRTIQLSQDSIEQAIQILVTQHVF